MPFCQMCGAQLYSGAKFCQQCGAPAALPETNPKPISIALYCGAEKTLSFMGQPLSISAEMDVFNHYRKEFRKFARSQVEALKGAYYRRIQNLDAFLAEFLNLYFYFRKPLIDAALNVLSEAELYDLSPQQFEEQHTNDFCLCRDDVNVMIESFNQTIVANQERKARGYNMMPGFVFRGVGGLIAAVAVNAAVASIAEADIRNANVTPRQRAELYTRINSNVLMERAFLDYWRIFLSMTWWMQQRGLAVWYPNEQDNQRANGIYQNLCTGRIPQERIPEYVVTMLQLNPYAEEYLNYIFQRFGRTEETKAMFDYFGFERIR